MKIYTVTFLINNYGSLLQAFALQSRLREFGAEPEILVKLTKQKPSRLRSWLSVLKPVKHYSLMQRIKKRLHVKRYAEKNKKLSQFKDSNISYTNIEDESSFCNNLSTGDLFLAGSDQIWSVALGPLSKWHTLQWIDKKGIKKYSYAASLGLSELSEEQLSDYKAGLSDFQVISLREKQAVKLLSPIFPTKVRQDLDPTLLYDKTFWRKIEAPRLVEGPYVFVYMLRPDNNVIKLAKRVAKEKGYKVIYTGLLADHYQGVETVCDAGIPEFLSYIDHAAAVVVNSFHGTVFSVLFEKPFLSVKVSSTSSRVESFLEMIGLMPQYVEDVNGAYSLNPDFSAALKILEKERDKSLEYLKSIVAPNNEG